MTERVKNIDVALIYELWREVAVACQAGDLERWLSLWIEEGIQMAPDVSRRLGKAQIRAALQPTFELFIMSDMVINTEEVRVLGDWAYSHGTYTFDMTPMQGGQTRSFSGSFLDIVVKQADGSWKIAIDCHNYDDLSG